MLNEQNILNAGNNPQNQNKGHKAELISNPKTHVLLFHDFFFTIKPGSIALILNVVFHKFQKPVFEASHLSGLVF